MVQAGLFFPCLNSALGCTKKRGTGLDETRAKLIPVANQVIPAFTQLTALAAEWQRQLPLEPDREERLWKKLRLELNYHSNHLEGNTLTYGETELLLIHDRTKGNHTHREYLEMKAHNVGIEHVRALAADKQRTLTEGDIRDLNKIILKEPFWKPALTEDGQPTRKKIKPGDYKSTPNNVRTATGEMFYFASVEDTPPRMQALAAKLLREMETPTVHPAEFAARLHHEFVLIHPFDDGNGRVARLLVNYVLLRSGYLPAIVRTEDKASYLAVLQHADAGDHAPLIAYIANLAEWSMQLGLKAARGESIDEPSDVEREIALFVRAQDGKMATRTPKGVRHLREKSIGPFLTLLEKKMRSLAPLFGESRIGDAALSLGERMGFAMKPLSFDDAQAMLESVLHRSRFFGYSGKAKTPFDFNVDVEIRFEPAEYEIIANGREMASLPYNKFLVATEADELTARILDQMFTEIKTKAGQL